MNDDNKSSSVTIGSCFISLLTVLFIGLKLAHIINWSWFWVLSPIVFEFVFVGLGVLFVVLLLYIKDKRKK